MAADFLHDVKRFLGMPWLTRVHFAQFQDSGGGNFSGMIDIDGHRKAVFNAYAAYSRMPIDRVQCASSDPAVEGLAAIQNGGSRTERRLLVWNTSDEPKHVQLDLTAGADIGVNPLRIDGNNNSPADGTPDQLMSERRYLGERDEAWDGNLPPHGVVMLAPYRGDGDGRAVDGAPIGRVVRELHDYPDRASRCYADFDRRTFTARLGMAGEDRATARVGATVDGMSDVTLSATTTGTLRPAATAGVRVDYQSKGGAYTKAILYRLTDGGATDAPVWGTARPADAVEAIADAKALRLKDHAPPDWTGRVQVSFVLADAGRDAGVTFRLSKP